MKTKVNKNLLAIYGIQDSSDEKHAVMVHDHSLAYFESGRISRFCQLERVTGIKYDNTLHTHIDKLLRQSGLTRNRVDIVSVDHELGRAFISGSGKIRIEAPLHDSLKAIPEKANLRWMGEKGTGFAVNHELAHVYSCIPFSGMFRNNSLLVHYDGGASKSNFSAWHYLDNTVSPVEYNYDLKCLTSIFNANALVFAILKGSIKNQNSVPGKLMGYAAYGKFRPELEEWLRLNGFFAHIWNNKEEFFARSREDMKISIQGFDQKNLFLQDIAATLHTLFVRESFNKFKELRQKTGAEFLYYSGGSALNIKLNTVLVRSGLFRDVFIPPCSNDSGLSIGAGAACQLYRGIEVALHSPFLNNWGIEDYKTLYTRGDIERIAELLIKDQVIGICNGYGEAGPRALGNRSVIARASSLSLAQKVSIQHKGREWYRPVAPVMTLKNACYFTGENPHHLSKYMLLDHAILHDKKKELEGCIHADGSSRIQVLYEPSDNPFLFELLDHLDKYHDVKALINTSFNYRGEPMVHTAEDARKAAVLMKLDALVVNGRLDII